MEQKDHRQPTCSPTAPRLLRVAWLSACCGLAVSRVF